jgi:hypothetical protein
MKFILLLEFGLELELELVLFLLFFYLSFYFHYSLLLVILLFLLTTIYGNGFLLTNFNFYIIELYYCCVLIFKLEFDEGYFYLFKKIFDLLLLL